MSQPPGQPHLNVRGAVDLSSLGRPAAPPPGSSEGVAPEVVVDVTDQSFADVVQRSTEVPVVLSMWAQRDPHSSTVTATLATLVTRLAGRILLGRIDVERSPGTAQAIGQQGATVVAVVQGQAIPLPPLEQATEEQIAAVLEQVLEMAAANGVTGRIAVDDVPEQAEPEEPPLPPLHQEAYDAIERGDLEGAVSAYERALAENPRDDMARAGLAQVSLLRRTADVDPAAARDAAAADPADVDAQLRVADLDVLGGQVEDAFARLVDTVRATSGEERERARVRLVELFTVVGDADPRVMAARRALASALY